MHESPRSQRKTRWMSETWQSCSVLLYLVKRTFQREVICSAFRASRYLTFHSFRNALTLAPKDPRMDDLIQNASQLFDDPLPSNSPPLPDAPPGEPAPVYNYGSSHTRVGSVLPRPLSPRQNEDFTPRLPLRPAYSIHPSLRAGGPVSPIQATMDIPPIPHPFEELMSENTNTSAEPNVAISPPPSLSALSPHSSSVSLPAASDFPVHQRNESSSSNL